jgi:hypothetical protein
MARPDFAIETRAPGKTKTNYKPGYGLYDPAGETIPRSDFTIATWGAVGADVHPSLGNLSSCVYIQEIDTIIPRPYWRYEQIAMSSNWNESPYGAWEELPVSKLGDTKRYHMYVSNTSEPTALWSKAQTPAEPCFAILVQRYGLPVDFPWHDVEPRTVIYFSSFALEIPWWRPARLRYRGWELPGSPVLDEFDISGAQSAENRPHQFVVSIMFLKGSILFSTDFGASWHVYNPIKDPSNWLVAPGFFIGVVNYGGRWAMGYIPIDAPGNAVFNSNRKAIGYTTGDEPLAYGGRMPTDSELSDVHEAGDLYTANGVYGGISVSKLYPTVYNDASYQVTMVPTRAPFLGTYMGRFPQLYSVRLMVKPEIADNTQSTTSVIAKQDVTSLNVEFTEDLAVSSATLTLNNNDGQAYEDLAEYTPIKLSLQGDAGDMTDVFEGFITRIRPSIDQKDKRVEVVCENYWRRFKDIFCTELDPCFAGWYTEQVYEWYAKRCGVNYSSDLNRLVRLPDGIYGDRVFQPEPGRSVADFLNEIARYEHYYADFDGDTLTYQKDTRFTTGTASFYVCLTNADYDSAPSPKYLARLSAETPRDPENHRNVVRVMGQDPYTRNYLIAVKKDEANIALIGWEKQVVDINPAYTTQKQVQLVCNRAFLEYSKYPARTMTVRLLGVPGIKPYQCYELRGIGTKADEQVFRITSVRHEFAEKAYWTTVEGKWVGDSD